MLGDGISSRTVVISDIDALAIRLPGLSIKIFDINNVMDCRNQSSSTFPTLTMNAKRNTLVVNVNLSYCQYETL